MIVIEPKKKDMLDYLIPVLGVLISLFLSLHLAVSYDNAKKIPIVREVQTEQGIVPKEYFNTSALITDFGNRLEKNLQEVQFTESTPAFLFGSLLLSLLIAAYVITSKKKLISGKEYGTAKWADKKTISRFFASNIAKKEIKNIKRKKGLSLEEKKDMIAAIEEKYADADMIFTKTERISMYNYELNNNTLIIGGSGSGKTRSFVMPNILQAHSSYVITDPKGEILEKSGHFLKDVKGYKIRVLNLDEKTLSNGYNPFKYIHKEREGWEERVLSLIETIIVNTDGGEKQKSLDPFWDKAERLFLQSIFFATAQAFPPEQSNMNTASELIRWLDIEEEGDNYDSDLDIFFQCFAAKYGDDNIAVEQFKEFRSKASGKTAKSVVISSVARLAPFKIKEIRRIFAYDDMHLEMVGEEKTAVFVILPPVDRTYNFVAGMLFTQLFQELNYCALNLHKHDGQRLPVPCRFILDEFANTCTIPNFIMIQSYARSLGIGIVTILQSLDQIKNMYKDEWGVIIDNSNTLLYLGNITHMDTLEYLSKLLGKGTFDKRSSSRTKGRQSSTSTNNDRIGRELLDPSEIRKLKNNKCLLFVGGQDPFYSKKFNYKQHKNYKFTSDGNKNLSYTYKPSPPPSIESIPHGEETDAQYVPPMISFKEIQTEFGQENIAEYLSVHVLNTDFDPDELLIVNDGEHEEIALFAELEREEADISDTMDSILSKVIEFKADPLSGLESGLALVNAEIDSPGSTEFDNYEVNDGEPPVVDEYELDDELDSIVEDAQSLKIEIEENMSAFVEQLNHIDPAIIESITEDSENLIVVA